MYIMCGIALRRWHWPASCPWRNLRTHNLQTRWQWISCSGLMCHAVHGFWFSTHVRSMPYCILLHLPLCVIAIKRHCGNILHRAALAIIVIWGPYRDYGIVLCIALYCIVLILLLHIGTHVTIALMMCNRDFAFENPLCALVECGIAKWHWSVSCPWRNPPHPHHTDSPTMYIIMWPNVSYSSRPHIFCTCA